MPEEVIPIDSVALSEIEKKRDLLQTKVEELKRQRDFEEKAFQKVRKEIYYKEKELDDLRNEFQSSHDERRRLEQSLISREEKLKEEIRIYDRNVEIVRNKKIDCERKTTQLSKLIERTTKSRIGFVEKVDKLREDKQENKRIEQILKTKSDQIEKEEESLLLVKREVEKEENRITKRTLALETKIAAAEKRYPAIRALKRDKLRLANEIQGLVDHNNQLTKQANRYQAELGKSRKLRAALKNINESLREEKANHQKAARRIRRLESDRQKKSLVIEDLTQKLTAQFSFTYAKPFIFDWIMGRQEGRSYFLPDDVVLVGQSPIEWDTLVDTLTDCGIGVWENASDVDCIIVGRDGWTPDTLDSAIGNCSNFPYVYSQEMFLAACMLDENLFDIENEELLLEFGRDHPALEYLMQCGFEWPEVGESLSDNPELVFGDWADESPLRRYGYQVGVTAGLPQTERKNILSRVFEEEIEWMYSDEYMEDWGAIKSRRRLWRMAHHLSWLIRFHRNTPNFEYAIDDWENDREWLRGQYYKPWMQFSWPYR